MRVFWLKERWLREEAGIVADAQFCRTLAIKTRSPANLKCSLEIHHEVCPQFERFQNRTQRKSEGFLVLNVRDLVPNRGSQNISWHGARKAI